MFTGIIEALGVVESITKEGSNLTFWIKSPISKELKIDQSIAHDGVCLTVEEVTNDLHRVTAIDETLNKSTLRKWQPGQSINLERCLLLPSRLDGHMVQGHVDTTAKCIHKTEKQGSWEYEFEFMSNPEFESLIVEKGSISLNGTSLTIFNVKNYSFTVAIIPYTFENTSIKLVEKGTMVNIEFDLVGKYILRNQQVRNKS
jgi:riboflavin synthase